MTDAAPVRTVGVSFAGEELIAARDQATAANPGIAAAIVGKDASLWGPDAATEAAIRLGWLDCVEVSRPLVPRIEALRDRLRADGVDHVVLAGMGGSSLAPEVIAATYGVELTALDTTDPGQIAAALSDRLAGTRAPWPVRCHGRTARRAVGNRLGFFWRCVAAQPHVDDARYVDVRVRHVLGQ